MSRFVSYQREIEHTWTQRGKVRFCNQMSSDGKKNNGHSLH